MNYIPLRTYSVFSQGEGVVDPASLCDLMQKAKVPYLPVCDPMSLIGWEKFHKEASARGLKPLLGTEIKLPEKGSLLLYPASPAGYPVTGAAGTAGGADTGSPRAFFGALRRGRTFSIEFRDDFEL